jgi:hypothetical protein
VELERKKTQFSSLILVLQKDTETLSLAYIFLIGMVRVLLEQLGMLLLTLIWELVFIFNLEQSRRDDLESLGYILVYFLKGELPWQGLKAKTMKEKYERIMEKKISTSIETLCKGFPEELQIFIHYTRDLRFDDRPDYGFLKRLIKAISEREKIEMDFLFDWVKRKEGEKKEEVQLERRIRF